MSLFKVASILRPFCLLNASIRNEINEYKSDGPIFIFPVFIWYIEMSVS